MTDTASSPSLPLAELVRVIDGELHGDAALAIRGFSGLESAGAGEITFAVGERWRAVAASSKAAALVVDALVPGFAGAQVVHPDPNLAFAKMVSFALHAKAAAAPGIHASATVHADAEVDPSATIGPQTVIEAGARIGAGTVLDALVYIGPGARVGANCRLRPGARVMDGCLLGDRVVLQPNAVIGGDGFGYATDSAGHHVKVPQTGIVRIEDDVEIGSGATIDRARFAETRIGRGTKIDNLVMIAHNVEVGDDSLLVAQAGIAGSSRLGKRNVLGGGVGVAGHLQFEDDVQVAAFSGVNSNLRGPQAYYGVPAMPLAEGKKAALLVKRLPRLLERIKKLERRLAELEPEDTESP